MNEFRKSIELTEEQKKEIERKQYEKHKAERNQRELQKPKWKNAQKEIFEDNLREMRY